MTDEYNKHIPSASEINAQALDSDLTSVAALSTTTYGRAFLELANASALKTLVDAAAVVAASVAVGGITGLGSNVATALAVAVGSAGAPVVLNGAGGTPSSITLTNATGTAASLTAGATTNVTSGTYTPTVSNVSNAAASTTRAARYTRIGNVVHVSGQVDVDATTTLTITQIRISLPIASNFSSTLEGSGVIVSDKQLSAGRIESENTTDTMQASFVPTSVANDTFNYVFTYEII